MILSVPSPSRVKGTIVGGSKSRIFTYWDTFEVLVRGLEPTELALAAEIVFKRGAGPAVTRSYFGIKGKAGLYAACSTPLNRLGHEPAAALDLVPENARDVLRQRPNLKSIDQDHSISDAAVLQRKLDDCFVTDGVLYVPTAEPYAHVLRSGEETWPVLEYMKHKNTDGNIRSFRLPDFEKAMTTALSYGASPEKIAHFKRTHDIRIHDPSPFRYDPANGEIVYATRMILEMHETSLAKMPIDAATLWLTLRDEVKEWASDEDASPIPVISRSQEALRAFDRFNRISETTAGAIAAALQRASERFVDEELVAFSATPGQ